MQLFGKNELRRREIASLTKIMTCLVACRLIKSMKIPPQKTYIKVSSMAASLTGTTANLSSGDYISIWDLLHGLMLPSGNDAAYCIAENFGTYLQTSRQLKNEDSKKAEDKKCQTELPTNEDIGDDHSSESDNNEENKDQAANEDLAIDGGDDIKCTSKPVKFFVDEMNRVAATLGLKNTHFDNPHGLQNKYNKSTALDVAKLSRSAMTEELFRTIVNTKNHECYVLQNNLNLKEMKWENTNRLLDRGFDGVKTGHTQVAGPCLSASYTENNRHVIAVILSCKSVEARFLETNKIVKWGIQYYDTLLKRGSPV